MEHQTHPNHDHEHRAGSGHTAVRHDDHLDFLHDGHLHSSHGDHFDEHVLPNATAAECTSHSCAEHSQEHRHGTDCGHEAIPHGTHTDYVVSAHLHHQHGDHCDDHGALILT